MCLARSNGLRCADAYLAGSGKLGGASIDGAIAPRGGTATVFSVQETAKAAELHEAQGSYSLCS